MAQELPASADSPRLKRVLSQWRQWQAPLTAEPVPERKLGGLSNDNYLVSDGEHRHVVRLNNDRFELDVNRQLELQVMAHISDRDFAPQVVFASGDCLVTTYIDGVHPECPDPAAMGELFARIHATNIDTPLSLDPYLHLERYMSRVTRPPRVLQTAFKAIMSGRSSMPSALCLCHNDLLAANLLDTGEGLVAIDWEYARPGDAAFDMAVVVQTYDFDEGAVARMLSAYGAADSMAARIGHYVDVYALVEICWWLIRGRDVTSLSPLIEKLTARLGLR